MKAIRANIFKQLDSFEKEVARLEGKILALEQKLERLIQIERNHLVRVKNHEEVSDDFIHSGRAYNDLTPERAWKLYNNIDFDFILVDVSAKDFTTEKKLIEALHIPLEELPQRFMEIASQTIPLFIISEDGTSSVLACEFLAKHGFYNCNNISGGYKFWKGGISQKLEDKSA